ncbi:Ceramide kinase [Vigna angularis]|uniref:Ceramide kinase n=1 Tax=Phaseolus angularis TaxID=3914 RepID=A0A8T0JG14_PHAAN|nr:ceramide kinase isoform X2 [Vigna angularis]KAG2372099.1 Ceramide kinase [Vigna angularis]
MEREGNDCDVGDTSLTASLFDGEASVLSSTFLLDHVGEVTVTFHSDRLYWKLVGSLDNDISTCLRVKYFPKAATEIKLSEIYAVELNGHGSIYISSLPPAPECLLLGQDIQMYRFTVHGFIRSKNQPSQCILADYTFGHTNLQVCRKWVNQLNASLKQEVGRPKNLLVFVHPRSGKGNGCRTWEAVAPIFSRARVETKVIVTERAGEAFDVMSSITNMELNSYDGVVAVGGDGFFNEILNGFLSPRFKAPYPPTPSDFVHVVKDNGDSLVNDEDEIVAETSSKMEDQFPLISSPKQFGSRISNLNSEDKAAEFPVPNEWFRFGIIPAGSTDAIVICTTGTRDPITSALHIVLGKRVHLDIAQVVRWKMTPSSEVEPNVRYAASFSGYGFYGDVITESEKYRWMGPTRYDYAGTMVFLKHRSYEAEIAYLDVESDEINLTSKRDYQGNLIRAIRSSHISERRICRTNCNVCNEKPNHASVGVCSLTPHLNSEETRWARSKGHFLSVGAAVISCRNEKAPDGLVADAHLSDGFLHLILIRDCPHASYLWHLTQLTRRGGSPLNFKFVEHHKTPAFTFTSSGDESVWNVDGEIFQAHQLSAQVFRGLVSMFASGPEV